MKTVQSIDSSQVDTLLGIALLIGTPFFVVFGWLSDKIGRKTIMMTGMLLAIFLYRPIYRQMYHLTDAKEMAKNNIPMKENKRKEMYLNPIRPSNSAPLAPVSKPDHIHWGIGYR